MTITLHTTLGRNTEIRFAAVDAGEAVMLNVRTGECYALNFVAVRIWELLEQPMTVTQICAQICE